ELGEGAPALGHRNRVLLWSHPPPFRAEELEEVGGSAGTLSPASIESPPPHPTSPPPRAERSTILPRRDRSNECLSPAARCGRGGGEFGDALVDLGLDRLHLIGLGLELQRAAPLVARFDEASPLPVGIA